PVRIAQVLGNLLSNSAKYTPEGGHIRLSAQFQDGGVEIIVEDDGMGIPADILPYVFDPFVQGERARERADGGLGIGLALTKGLVELHGGRIQASSAGPDHGSIFRVWLPVLRESVEGGSGGTQ